MGCPLRGRSKRPWIAHLGQPYPDGENRGCVGYRLLLVLVSSLFNCCFAPRLDSLPLMSPSLSFLKARGIIQNKVPLWKEQLEASRTLVSSHSQSRLSASPSSGYLSGRLTPSHLEMVRRMQRTISSSGRG